LDPLKSERVDHVIAAVGLLVASFAAIVLSVVVDVRYSRLPM
jgi:hypothetical protein